MALSFYLFVSMGFILILLSYDHVILTNCSSSIQQLCHENERFALLQFKHSLSIDKSASGDPSSYPKVDSWGLQENNSSDIDCCLWDGIECNEDSGHVIGLDLNSSLLYGSINSNSSLFHLAHLQRLNLADNHFNYSQIPSAIGHLSGLTSLNLSQSVFFGQIPIEILNLSRLVSLDLSNNVDPLSVENLLKLENFNLKSLVQNLSGLKEISLSGVNIFSEIPNIMANLSSLTSLLLEDCGLHGEFQVGIFHLPNLEALSMSLNQDLVGSLPEFNQSSPLENLRLGGTSFSGRVPDSIANLKSLNVLDLSQCGFTGSIPSSLGNLTQLTWLALDSNNFHGQIPRSVFTLNNLITLDLQLNNLSGTVETDMFLRLKDLIKFQLSGNKLSVLPGTDVNVTLPKFKFLGLSECNLNDFPEFLQYQTELVFLELSGNKIHGHIPKWIWNVGEKTLNAMRLAFNFLIGFEQLPNVLPWESLQALDLSSNCLEGPLPIPPFIIVKYVISDNFLNGEIPQILCNASSLSYLDLSNNSLSGIIPECLSSFSSSLTVLDLRSNNFHGTIPQSYNKGSNLRVMDLGQNKLDGPVPRSLANCTMLELLDLGNNQIQDIFPFWLGTLPELKILLLRSNRFHGTMIGYMSNFDFPKLCIIDLSHNCFTGDLPSKYFQNWNATKLHEVGQSLYFQANNTYHVPGGLTFVITFTYSMTMRNKGLETFYPYIITLFAAIDFSSNKFNGEIPESIGNLKGLQLLNLSNNGFTGSMPSSLGKLIDLQALDVSQNELSGKIPQQLAQLTFLAFLNVSHNHLQGAIPQGNQFDTFENYSFDGNPKLCGGPLSKKCGSSEVLLPPPLTVENGNSNFPSKFNWIFICMGYGSGLVVGLVIGHILTTRKHEWFVETFARRQPKIGNKNRAQRG